MSYKEKNVIVTLSNFTLILVFYLIRVFQMIQSETFNSTNVFRLWGIIIFLAVIVTIVATILTHLVPAVMRAAKTGEKAPKINDTEDERDKLIDLRGTKVTYFVSSVGSFFAMLTFVFGHPPLVMFTMLIFFGVFGQVVGDISRLVLYRDGMG